MKQQFYLESEDSENCYTEDYFQIVMRSEGLDSMEVFKAVTFNSDEFYYCKYYGAPGERGDGECGKSCDRYDPRNGKNGVCRHHSTRMYSLGEKVTLRRRLNAVELLSVDRVAILSED